MSDEWAGRSCDFCHSPKVIFKEWNPDGATYYFCSYMCYSSFRRKTIDEGLFYRAFPVEDI